MIDTGEDYPSREVLFEGDCYRRKGIVWEIGVDLANTVKPKGSIALDRQE
jgi:hypothetical protein